MDTRADPPGVRGMVVPPGGGRAFGFGPYRPTVKVGPEAGGRFGVIESVLSPGAGPAPHRHQRYDEAFYVLEGQIEYCVGDRRVTATAGTFVFAPARCAHGFRNVGANDARHLVITAPAEALDMVEAVYSGAPDQLAAVFARYDTELVDGG
jgi:quercetin dioxygenase-like cupin family protein